ncbi:1,4-dihydroxy-2-naphthoate octaprenyltransferase [Bacillus sp. JCM 19046]|nr:1,4-dihydroxy-2-naphthoate octaprenyltransferase [Bacillus sp. JCM 19045]GAF19167.1 1,4-dihydroxy-2-naphthoate octaprenyltransferase [Bacillus sp. JCM 19046]
MSKVSFWLKAARAQVLPVMILPVVLGGAAAFSWENTFHVGLFLLTLIGAASAHLFSNMVNDLWDFRNGVDQKANSSDEAISTNSGLLPNGRVSEKQFARVTWIFLGIAVLSGITLAILTGITLLLFVLVGGLIAYFYVAPPLKFGYRGKGYSELAIFLAFGVLPVMGTYFVLTSTISLHAFLISIPIGLLTTLILFNHHFLHWKADKEAGKKTLVVLWGENGGLRFSKSLALVAYISVPILSIVGALPWYANIAILTAIPLFYVYQSLGIKNKAADYGRLMGASLRATIRTGLVLVFSLLLVGLL